MCWNMDQIPGKARVSAHVNSDSQVEICYCSGRWIHPKDNIRITEKVIINKEISP